MPSWASSLTQKTEVLGTTLSWPRARGLSGKPVLTHCSKDPWEGRMEPLWELPSSNGLLSFHASSTRPVPQWWKVAWPLCPDTRPGREGALGSHPSTEQAVC